MKIRATRIATGDLKEGDLFSNVGPAFWAKKNLKMHEELGATGQKVYIRTGRKLSSHAKKIYVYKLKITKK